ncbi:T9SS type A sorting domain-containing protein [Marinilabilia sp.]
MKKLFTIGLAMLLASGTFAQSTHTIDFEPSGVGADWDWTVTENGTNPALEFVSNPSTTGINTSATVAKFIAEDAGQDWALCFTDDNGQFTFDETNSTIKMMVYKPVETNVAFKVEGLGPATQIEVTNTVVGQWEELTFDFSSVEGQTYSRLVIIPDLAPRDADHNIYIDNIQVPDGVIVNLPEPTTEAPVPTMGSDNVLSIYSDAYTDLAGTNFNPGWGQSTQVTVDYSAGGFNTLKYTGLNFQGTEFASAQDLSGYQYLHVDFWTPNSTRLDFFLISPGAETAYSLPVTTEEWVSVDIPLSSYSSVVDLSGVIQFKVDGNGTVYFDNWYFHNGTPTSLEETEAQTLKVFPNPVEDFLNVRGIQEGETIEIYNTSGSLMKQSTIKNGGVSTQDLPKGMYLIKTDKAIQKVVKK